MVPYETPNKEMASFVVKWLIHMLCAWQELITILGILNLYYFINGSYADHTNT